MVLQTEADAQGPRIIQQGDLVIVYESYTSIKSLYVDPKGQFSNRFGNFAQKDWIGKPFGSKVYCKSGARGWVHLLAPTPELWTLVLRHRTQILYVADISLVCMHLQLFPGSVVLESGTGSGSLTHSLARAVAPTGHVHTFEFHELRANEARAEFDAHQLQHLVTVAVRNVEEMGFPEHLAELADGVFLDLPGPWKVVPSAARCLKPDGKFCAFSPCIEQVQRTVEALDSNGFTDVSTLECLLRNYEVFEQTLTTGILDTSSSNGTTGSGPGGLKSRMKRQRQEGECSTQPSTTGEVGPAPGGEEVGADQQGPGDDTDGEPKGANPPEELVEANVQQQQHHHLPEGERGKLGAPLPSNKQRPTEVGVVVARPAQDARGHTGYLTFARKFVAMPAAAAGATPGLSLP